MAAWVEAVTCPNNTSVRLKKKFLQEDKKQRKNVGERGERRGFFKKGVTFFAIKMDVRLEGYG
jgi:hypothetical protein